MPELPEVEAALRRLERAAVGRIVARVQLFHATLRRRVSAVRLRSLSGAQIDRVERRGKHQLLHFADGRILHVHFRMNGDWEFGRATDALPRFARAVLEFNDGTRVALVDSRALGTLNLYAAGAVLDLGLGPDAADPAWTGDHLAAALASRRGPIKPALLDQKLVAGLGNIYVAESLWRARIDPRASSRELTSSQVRALRRAIAAVLKRATGARYTDDSTLALNVYDREGLPCKRCDVVIRRIVQAGRSTYYCASCQK